MTHLLEPDHDVQDLETFKTVVSDPADWSDMTHAVLRVSHGQWSSPSVQNSTIVSHLDLNWARLPLLVALRAAHPAADLIHLDAHSDTDSERSRRPGPARASLLRSCLALFDKVLVRSPERLEMMLRARLVDEGKVTLLPAEARAYQPMPSHPSLRVSQ